MNYVKIQDLPEITSTSSTTYAPVIDGASSRTSKIKYSNLVKSANNLTTTTEGYVLDGRQGKVLDDKITGLSTSRAPIANPAGGANNYAPLANPTFTGSVTVDAGIETIKDLTIISTKSISLAGLIGGVTTDTQLLSDVSTKVATTEFVKRNLLSQYGENIAIGYNSLLTKNDITNAIGGNNFGNIVLGYLGMSNNTTGKQNIALGWGVMRYNETGNANIALGADALGFSYRNTNSNVAIGNQALRQLSVNSESSLYNIAIGEHAGKMTNGDSNGLNQSNDSIFIGRETKSKSENSINEIVIGKTAIGKGNNTVVLGNDSIIETHLKGKVFADSLNSKLNAPTVLNHVHTPNSTPFIECTITNGTGTLVISGADSLFRAITANNTTDDIYIGNRELTYNSISYDGTDDVYTLNIISTYNNTTNNSDESFVIPTNSVITQGPWNPIERDAQDPTAIKVINTSNADTLNIGDTIRVTQTLPTSPFTVTTVDYAVNGVVETGAIGSLYNVHTINVGSVVSNISTDYKVNYDNNVTVTIIRNTANNYPIINIDGYIEQNKDNSVYFNSSLKPNINNFYSLGSSFNAWKDVWAIDSSINASDSRKKTIISALTQDELNAAKQLSKEMGTYKWLSAIAEKGDKARKHIGMTVQRAIEIMTANNLDPFDYGFICYDEWQDEFKTVIDVQAEEYQAAYSEEIGTDDEGNPIVINHPEVPAVEEVSHQEQITVAGNSYSFRYTELLAFIAAGIEARLTALEFNIK
jgi:hypothetical protein